MKRKPLFGYCADFLNLNNAILGDLITEHSTKRCDEHRAKRIREGTEPVPADAWSALRSNYNEHCPKAQKLISYLALRRQNRFLVTVADLESPVMSDTIIRAILQLPTGINAAYDPYAPPDEETWGQF